MAEFHELHGDYVANTGQTISLREYLDYFEPLGSALSRLPDGVGGPFVHHFTGGGGRTIGSIGWVVSAASKRFGAWTLWGMWSDRAIPAVALPLFWNILSDPAKTSEMVRRANDEAARLADRRRWADLLDEVKTLRLRDDALRESLTAELARAWAVPPPHRHSIEVEVTPRMLDVLPWLYILGPVDPTTAQLQPSRFNDAGYQYILDEHRAPARAGAALAFDVGELVDTAASDVVAAWRMANELRAQRGKPKRAEKLRSIPAEKTEMRKETSSTPVERRPPRPSITVSPETMWTALYRIAVIAFLAWIAWNVNVIRKTTPAPREVSPTVSPVPETAATPPEPAPEDNPSRARVARVSAALVANSPRNIRLSEDIARSGANDADTLATVAIEIFLRRNVCHPRTDVVDGKLSATEQRAIRNCGALQEARLMASDIQPDAVRAIDWLERIVTP